MRARRAAFGVAALLLVGLLVFLAMFPSSPPAVAPNQGRRPQNQGAGAGPSATPRLRGEPSPSRGTEDAEAVEPRPRGTPPEAWILEVEVRDEHGDLLRGVPQEGGGTSLPVRIRFLPEGGGEPTNAHPDAEGLARLEVRGAGRVAALPTTPPWQPFVSEALTPPQNGERRIEITLRRGLAIAGVLLDHRGQPAPWGQIRAVSAQPTAWGARRTLGLWVARPGEGGAFRIEGLLPGRYRLEVDIPTWALGVDPGRPPPPPEVEAGTAGVEIRLLPPTSYVLEFVDEETGEAVSVIAQIYCVDDEGETSLGCLSGATYKVGAAPEAGGVLLIEAEGYRPHRLAQEAFVAASRERTIRVLLEPDIEGRIPVVLTIQDDEGRSVERVLLTRWMTMGRDRTPAGGRGQTLACEEGRLELVHGPGPITLDLGAPAPPPRVKGAEEPDPLRFLLTRRLQLDLHRGVLHEETVVLKRGGAVRIHNPRGVQFGSFVHGRKGEKVPRCTHPRHLGNGDREHVPIPAGDWILLLLLGERKLPVEVTVRPGAVTEVTLDPTAFPDAPAKR